MLRENGQQARLQSPKSFPFMGPVLFRFPENRSKRLFLRMRQDPRLPRPFAGLKQVTREARFGTTRSESDYNYEGVKCCFPPDSWLRMHVLEVSRSDGKRHDDPR